MAVVVMLVEPVLLTDPPAAVTETVPPPDAGVVKYASTQAESPPASVTLVADAELLVNPGGQLAEIAYWPSDVPRFATRNRVASMCPGETVSAVVSGVTRTG